MNGGPDFDELMTAKIAVLEIMLGRLIAERHLVTKTPVRKWADDFFQNYENSPKLAEPEGLLFLEALREFLDRVVAATEDAGGTP